MKVEGLPTTTRPRCANCGRPLKYWTDETREGSPSRVVRRVFTGWRGYPFGAAVPIFDTLRCALEFAVILHRAGYRRHQA